MPTGQFESTEYDVGYDSKFIVFDTDFDYKENGGTVVVEYSTSNDQVNWSAWHKLYELDRFIFENPSEESVYFKIRVTLKTTDSNNSPQFFSSSTVFKNTHKIENIGDKVCKPKLWLTKTNGDGNVELHNLETQQTLKFKNLKDGEQVFVDCEQETVITDIPLIYRYDDHNDVFIELIEGNNYLLGSGDFKLDVEYQMRLL